MPLLFQVWQISLFGQPSKLALYKQVRMFKTSAFLGAMCLTMWENCNLRKQMTFYDRFYPEPTELQKKLEIEAQMFKEQAYKEETVAQREAKVDDPDMIVKYSQFYMLAPQTHHLAEDLEGFNSPDNA